MDQINHFYAPMRAIARARHDKFYFTDRFCSRGHRALRYTSNGGCVACLGVQVYDREPLQDDSGRMCKRGHFFFGSQCPACHRSSARRWRRQGNPREASRVRQQARVATCRDFVRTYKTMHACTDCGQHYPWYVMEFDHLEPRARTEAPTISSLVGRGSLDRLIQNLSLVELVCANCHRTRTYQRHLAEGRYVDVRAS